MTSNRRITSTLKNLVKNGLAKNMFIFSSENYNLIRKIPEQTTMGNEKISKMIKHIVDFHRRYITEIGRKYKFMYITTRNCVFLIVPINEEKIAAREKPISDEEFWKFKEKLRSVSPEDFFNF